MAWSSKLFEDKWITVRGFSLHYCVSTTEPDNPDAPPIILLHGLGISLTYMLPTARLLARTHRIYLPELPGVGKSNNPPHLLDLAEQADLLIEWMDSVEISEAIFLGNSMGCQVITHLAVRYPQRITHAILISPTMDIRSPWMVQKLGLAALDIPFEPTSLIRIVLHDYLRAGIIRLLTMFHIALQDHIEERLPFITTPTLIVRGGLDPLVSRSWAEEVTKMLPQGQLVIVPNAGHAVNYNAPVKLQAIISTFLESTRTSKLNDYKNNETSLSQRLDSVPEDEREKQASSAPTTPEKMRP